MYKFTKRILDFFIALIALIILLPLFIPICIALLLTGEHEVFYFQKRVGTNVKPFYIWKFATMLKNSEKMGTGSLTIRNDPRVTVVGRFLRQTKINELPQLVNVLVGNMSLVGPRPLLQSEFDAYSKEIQEKVYHSKPGITGIGSAIFRDEEQLISNAAMPPRAFYDSVIAPYKGACEMWYNEHKSFWVDLKIVALTAIVIAFPSSSCVNSWFKGLPERDF
ncbi:MAG: sugar transferase [Prevotellaceae bacterium]|jgi:lipopolysaccharide/colanic/teichoic acid biosynthesis glycosyltransferase|nr:sugar transferase [Prevotellaceae bacterium]